MPVVPQNFRKFYHPVDTALELKAIGAAVTTSTTHGSYYIGGCQEVTAFANITAVTVTTGIFLVLEGGSDASFTASREIARIPVLTGNVGILNMSAITEQFDVTYPYVRLKSVLGASDSLTFSAYLCPDLS